jgi:hypothetical protein
MQDVVLCRRYYIKLQLILQSAFTLGHLSQRSSQTHLPIFDPPLNRPRNIIPRPFELKGSLSDRILDLLIQFWERAIALLLG